jgi:hypothetical protein
MTSPHLGDSRQVAESYDLEILTLGLHEEGPRELK